VFAIAGQRCPNFQALRKEENSTHQAVQAPSTARDGWLSSSLTRLSLAAGAHKSLASPPRCLARG
jgi:hypothetical protein